MFAPIAELGSRLARQVALQGLAVGRVRQVNPVMDTAAGGLSFVARLSIDATFPNGARVTFPRGTRAVIEQVNPIAPPVIQLIVPPATAARGVPIAPGDTIASERQRGAVDVLSGLATDLSKELHATIADTRVLLSQTTRAASQTARLLRDAAPRVQLALDRLPRSLDRADTVLAVLSPRVGVGPTADSLVAVLGEARQALHRVDALADTAQSVVGEDRIMLQVLPPPLDTTRSQP